MQEQKIKHVNIELKVIKLDLERISVRIEDTNRSVKNILINGEIYSRTQDLKELLNFSRFLLQKHKERVGDKQLIENRLKSFIQEENKMEIKLIEDEKRHEYLSLTIEKSLIFNHSHPFYLDESFISDLIGAFLKSEDYEKCAFLKKHLDSIN
jgi:hypothetical protein